jgi:SurA N-terminal domain
VLRRLIKASAIVIGVGLAVAACSSPVKMGAAAIVGNQRITIATLDTEVTNLSQAAARYPATVSLTASQRTQATLTWLIRYQIFEEMARQAGITVSAAQGQQALNNAVAAAVASAEQQGITNASQNLILAASGIPPNTSAELGRYEAIASQYLTIANGGTAPAAGSAAQTAAGNKLNTAECQAAKALNIAVNPQFGQLDYNGYQVVTAPSPVTRTQGPVKAASPVATAPAC